MNTVCYIIGAHGFLKSIGFNIESKEYEIIWTDKLRDAQRYTSKAARKLVVSKCLQAFVWNPFEEEPIRGKWKIVQRRPSYSFSNEYNLMQEWLPEQVKMQSKTDADVLRSKDFEFPTYFDSEQDALNACIVKNQEILDELTAKNKNLNQQLMLCQIDDETKDFAKECVLEYNRNTDGSISKLAIYNIVTNYRNGLSSHLALCLCNYMFDKYPKEIKA